MIPLFLMGLVTLMFSELARSALDRPEAGASGGDKTVDRFAAATVYIGTFLFFLTMLRIAFLR